MIEDIIPPVDVDILESELNEQRFIRITNNGSNELYIINDVDSPMVLHEIGRLREFTFRNAGGGTGKSMDLDEFDSGPGAYQQLIVWNPREREIMGGYRFIKCGQAIIKEDGSYHLATAELFDFSENFIRDYLPFMIELGRSFVQPKYQPSALNRKGLFTLDNLWDGLGAIALDNPDIRYFFGKVTMYLNFHPVARDLILYFMEHYFPDHERLVIPRHALPIIHDMRDFESELNHLPYKDGHRILNQKVRELGENIPPLINSYMNLSSSMRSFGTSSNPHFGEVEETCILVKLADIYETKKERHLNTYIHGQKRKR